jgi:hypothetical protein
MPEIPNPLRSNTPRPSTPDWEAIRRDYDAQVLTVLGVCAAHSISERRLYQKWQVEGWPLRQPFRARHVAVGQESLSARLVGALDKKLQQFEMRLKRFTDDDSAADSERDAKTLNMLVRLFEKLAVLQGADARGSLSRDCRAVPPDIAGRAGPVPETTATKDTHDQERLRGELARRLETLRGQIGG